MAILLAILCTLSIGVGEHLAGDATKAARSHEVTSGMFLSGAVITGITALVWPGDPTSRDLFFGALAGVTNGTSILLLYYAYSRGSLRTAAPTAGVVMAAVPVLWDVTAGAAPSALVWLGLGLGVAAIGFTSYRPADGEHEQHATGMAILAGIVFGVLFILLGEIGDDAGGTPLFIQRMCGLTVAVIATRLTGPRVFPADGAVRRAAVVVGFFATAAVILFVLAIQAGGSLAVVSVMGSQYAAVAVLIGVVVHRQPLRWWQAVGLAMASVSVALITVG